MTSSCSRAKACSSSRLADGAQRRLVLRRAAQPAQVHERRSHVLAAVDESGQHLARDVDLGVAELRKALVRNEIGEVCPHDGTHVLAPVIRNDGGRAPSVFTHALMRRNECAYSALTTVQLRLVG